MTEPEKKDLLNYRLTRAKETIEEVDILIENKLWNTAVNRLYYACFYAVSGLLVYNSLNAQTHAGVRQMFGLHFVKTGLIDKSLGKFYTDIFDKRQSGDYDDFISYTKDDVIDLLEPAKHLIKAIEKIVY